MKEYVSASARAGGKTVIRVSLLDGLLSAKAEVVTYVGNITTAVKSARAQARAILEELKQAMEGTS